MDDRQEALGNIWKGGAIVLGTFVLTLTIYFVCARFLDSTKNRFKPLARWSEPADAVTAQQMGRGTAYSPIAPGTTSLPPRVTAGGTIPPVYTPATPRLSAVPPYAPPIVAVQQSANPLYFSDAAERRRAQDAVYSLKQTMDSIHKLDGASFWVQLPTGNAVAAASAQPEDGAESRIFAANTEDTARRRQFVIARIVNETEAMATELALVAHPDLFPEALREQVKQISTEARIYLSTVQLALSRPEERDGMRRLAQAHLSRSEALLRNAQQAVGIL